MRWALWAGGREADSRGLGNMGESGDVAASETERREGYSLELAPARIGSMIRSRADWTILLTSMISSCPGVSRLPWKSITVRFGSRVVRPSVLFLVVRGLPVVRSVIAS